MQNTRLKKVSRLIQKELSQIFQRDCQHLFGNVLISVTHVITTPDLGIARVYLSFMLAPKPLEILDQIVEHQSHIRLLLGNRIRNQVRKIPALEFYIDDTQHVMQEVEKLFEGLTIPPAEPEDKD